MAIKPMSLSEMRGLSVEKELLTLGESDAYMVKDLSRDASPEPVCGIISGKTLKRLIELGILK